MSRLKGCWGGLLFSSLHLQEKLKRVDVASLITFSSRENGETKNSDQEDRQLDCKTSDLLKAKKRAFKKARELSTLCDAEIALIVFSATGKLFDYSSSSMMQLIERHNLHSRNNEKQDNLPCHSPLENRNHALLSKELMDKTRELRQLEGEELQGLSMEELMKLEKLIEAALSRVTKSKGDKYVKEINNLKKKEAQLKEENATLKQKMRNVSGRLETRLPEQGCSSDSVNDRIQPPDLNNSDTLLKLSLL